MKISDKLFYCTLQKSYNHNQGLQVKYNNYK